MLQSGDLVAERYQLAGLVGSGGMGTVWKAHDVWSERTVALKRPHSGGGDSQRSQLEAEARAAQRVNHPNAVTVYEVTADDCWLVMEYVPSRSLAEVLAEDGPLPPGTVARIGVQIATALEAAHAAGVVHRDVSPSNVLVGDDWSVKVTDFGISVWREATVTQSGKISGKPGYLAPEVAGGQRATSASDMFSLGATLFAVLEGSPPFGTGDPAAVLVRARAGEVPGCGRAGELGGVVAALMARNPQDRPSARRAVELLADVDGSRPPVPVGDRRPLRRRWLAAAALGVAAASTTALVWASWDSADAPGCQGIDLSSWKLTLPTGEQGHPDELSGAAIAARGPWFFQAGDCGLRFRAPVNGVTTGGSKYARADLRELSGSSLAAWSTSSGTHTLVVREAVTHLPDGKPDVVTAQVHDGEDDVAVFRLEGSNLYVTNGDDPHAKLITVDYRLGTPFEAKFVVHDGQLEAWYNGAHQVTIPVGDRKAYFKVGAYTQANCENAAPCSDTNYGEVEIHGLAVSHQG